MSLDLLIPDVDTAIQALVYSHASRGGSTCLYRNGKVWNNNSALSILNAWSPTHRVVQKAFLDVCGTGGDGCKLGVFIAGSLLKTIHKMGQPLTQNQVDSFLADFDYKVDVHKKKSTEDVLLSIGGRTSLPDEHLRVLCEGLRTAGVDSHIALEKGYGVQTEVIQSEALQTEIHFPSDEQINLKGAMFALFEYPLLTGVEVQEAMELMGGFEGRPLVVISPLMGKEVKTTINLNRNKGIIEAYGIEIASTNWNNGWLEDIAAFTGATVHTRLDSSFSAPFYGSALDVSLSNNRMIIEPYDDHAERTAERASSLLSEAATTLHPHTQDLYRKRAAALMGSLLRVKVGGVTESEARFNLNLAEKSFISMSDTLRNGYIEGSIPFLSQIETDNEVINHALKAPLRVVCHNTQRSIQEVLSNPLLMEPLPVGRFKELVERAFSVALTLGNIGYIIKSKR